MTDDIEVDAFSVSLEYEATADEVAAVQAAFDTFGLPARTGANFLRHSAGDLPWLISIGGSVSALIAILKKPTESVLDPTAQMLGERLRDWVVSLFAARKDRDGSVVIEQDRGAEPSRKNVEILLEPDLPPAAYEELAKLVDLDTLDEIPGECWQIRYIDGAWRRPW